MSEHCLPVLSVHVFSVQISDSLLTFGVAECTQSMVVAVFDDEKGNKMKVRANNSYSFTGFH